MKTTITIDIDGEDMTISEKGCTGVKYKLRDEGRYDMILAISGKLISYLLDEHEENEEEKK